MPGCDDHDATIERGANRVTTASAGRRRALRRGLAWRHAARASPRRTSRSSPTSTSTRSSPRSRSSRARSSARSRSSSAATRTVAASSRPRTTSRARFGIHSAMSAAEALRRCPQAVFVRPRHALYRQYSRVVWDVGRARSSRASSGPGSTRATSTSATVARDFTRARAVASAVQTAVRATTSLTCSLGVGTSKVVCKIASDRRKPGGITVVPPGTEARFLAPARRPPAARASGHARRSGYAARGRRDDRRARGPRRRRARRRSSRDRSARCCATAREGSTRATSSSRSSPCPCPPRTRSSATSPTASVLHAEVRRLAELVVRAPAQLGPLRPDRHGEAPVRRLLDPHALDDALRGGRRGRA